MLTIQRPSVTDVSVYNPNEIIYIKGDESTDGSIRIIPDISTGVNAEFQLRASGVWNDTGIQIAASTIFLGRDLEVKAAGDWILTTDVQVDHEALIPHIEFTDAAGTVPYAHVPILSPLIEDFPIQPDFSSEVITNAYRGSSTNPAELLVKRIKYKTGSVAATDDVTVSYNRPPGVTFWTQNYPASHFPANSDVTIELKGLLEGFPGETINTEIDSNANFSLKSDLSGVAYAVGDFYLLTEESLMTFESGLDNVITSFVNKDVMVNVIGNLMAVGAPNDVA